MGGFLPKPAGKRLIVLRSSPSVGSANDFNELASCDLLLWIELGRLWGLSVAKKVVRSTTAFRHWRLD
jgi:hypothetical protein